MSASPSPGGGLGKLTWVELKLFVREPLTIVFTLALPIITLIVLGQVFGNQPDPEGALYRGFGATNFYVPAYVALVVASMGVIGLPVHLADYRDRGVLRRFRASSLGVGSVLGSQFLVTLLLSIVGSIVLVAVAALIYRFQMPVSWTYAVLAFLVGVIAFASLGVLLGSVLPTARAAQGAGVILWFMFMMLGGAGPPPEILTGALGAVADVMPLRFLVFLMQDGWLRGTWSWGNAIMLAGIGVGAAALSAIFFRWES